MVKCLLLGEMVVWMEVCGGVMYVSLLIRTLGISEKDTKDLLINLKGDKKFREVVNEQGSRFKVQKNLLTI